MGPVSLQEAGIGLRASLLSYGVSVLSSGITGQDPTLDSYVPPVAVNAGLRVGLRIPENE